MKESFANFIDKLLRFVEEKKHKRAKRLVERCVLRCADDDFFTGRLSEGQLLSFSDDLGMSALRSLGSLRKPEDFRDMLVEYHDLLDSVSALGRTFGIRNNSRARYMLPPLQEAAARE